MATLADIAETTKEQNWDGSDARPVTAATVAMAERFAKTVPSRFDEPDFGAEPDGEITLEWYRNPHAALSLSISFLGVVSFALLLGELKLHGETKFTGEWPSIFTRILDELYTL